jgi:two-component system response regulator HydG
LDEIHILSLRAHSTLLRAIREKKIRRVGSSLETSIPCGIIAAVKPDLQKQVLNGSFLADLFYRLKFLTIDVPALRNRPEDIGLLVEHFCQQFAKENRRKISFRAKTIHIMEQYDWPGNIGELEGCVSQLLINAKDSVVSPDDLDERFKMVAIVGNPKATLADLEVKHKAETRDMISNAIEWTGSKRKAAKRLGINESSLRSLL